MAIVRVKFVLSEYAKEFRISLVGKWKATTSQRSAFMQFVCLGHDVRNVPHFCGVAPYLATLACGARDADNMVRAKTT